MKYFAGQTALVAVSVKELLHIWRDRRILTLIVFLPPIFTLLLGHAFEVGTLKAVPAILLNKDHSKESTELVDLLSSKDIFDWRQPKGIEGENFDLSQNKLQVAVIIPAGWGAGLHDGSPIPIRLVLDGADTHSAPEIQGAVQQIIGEYQSGSLATMIDNLPEEVFDLGKQLPKFVRKNFSSSMVPWTAEASILYNPDLKFIDFAMPGIVGLILQLFTVTLIASSLSRERESGTLFQLQVTPIQKSAIIVGKILPYLGIALLVELVLLTLGQQHFHIESRNPVLLLSLSVVFLLSTSGLGALISSFSRTQTQAIQFSVFFLLPVFLLSGAFAPLSQLPSGVRLFSYAFPLTYFCHACREINIYSADIANVTLDFLFLGLGALVTCSIAALRLRQSEV